VVDAIGDSITAGYARSGDSRGLGAEMDPGGGYPVRLRSLLDDGVEVRARGAGGTTLATWTTPSRGAPAALEALLRSLWPDLPPARHPPGPRQGALSWTLEVDRPDVVILLLGVNDLWTDALRGGPPDARGTAERLARAARAARASGARVLVATLLPNERDPAGAIEETNRRLCELEPDCIRLDERFARAGGPALLGDEVHPSPEGHRVVAEAMADALVDAGIARRRVPQGGGEPVALPVEPPSEPR
jgi:lysophospholipase L1-like esterase